jgi:homopolymeric O-antigen transport system permease protein
METLVDSPAPGEGQRSVVAPKKDTGDTGAIRGRPSILVLFQDLVAAFKAPGFWLFGAWIDTSLRHRSQALGAFWMVFGTLSFVLLLGTLYSQVLLRPGADTQIYYAHIATGFVLWIFIQQSLQQSSNIFKKNRDMIQNGYVKYVDYVLRLFSGHLISLAYNLLIVVGAILLTPVHVTAADFVLLLTVPLFFLAVLGVCFLLSVVGARYPDIGELMRSVMRLFFFITPIIWMPSMGKGAAVGAFIYLNPFYYLIEIIRGPLVYGVVPWFEVGVVAGVIPIIWLLAALAYARAKPYVALWI